MATAVPSLVAFFFAWTLLFTKAVAPPPPPSQTPSCTDELVLFSPCLSYVSSPPNNLDDDASANCCNAFSSAADSGAAVCFCYLLRKPPILGFPLNSTRLFSLSSVCPTANRTSARAPSLNSLCSESSALPPLNKSATLGLTSPSASAGSQNGASPSVRIPHKGGGSGGSTATLSKGGESNVHHSSETERICSIRSWLLPSIVLTIFVSVLATTL